MRLPDHDDLTDRERQILGLLVDGVTSNRRLAAALRISENTVKFHLRNILAKLQLADRAQVVGYVLRSGLAGTTSGALAVGNDGVQVEHQARHDQGRAEAGKGKERRRVGPGQSRRLDEQADDEQDSGPA